MSAPSFCLKYKVLKPHPAIAALSKTLLQVPNAVYQLSEKPEGSIRRYRRQCSSIEQLLQVAQWRHEAGPQVAHCHFLQLLKPNRETKVIEYEAYIEHMQVGLWELDKLITKESLYLLIQAARGYFQLFSKFKKVAVSPRTIGLNAQGSCIMWLHEDLASFLPQAEGVVSETGVICRIIEEIAKRSEPFCQGILVRLIDEIRRKQLTLSGFIEQVKNLVSAMRITLPIDLKYLVNQQRILNDVRNLKERMDSKEGQRRGQDVRSKRYRPVKTEIKQNIFSATQGESLHRVHRASNADILECIRVGKSFQSRKFITQNNLTRKKQSYISTNMSSFIGNSDKKLTVRNRSKCTDGADSHTYIFSLSGEKTVISKCKSLEGRCHTDINLICARPFQRLAFDQKNITGVLQNFMEYGHNSQFSDRPNSFRQKQKLKLQTEKIYKSFILQFGSKPNIKNKGIIGEECEQHESSPKKQKLNQKEQSYNSVNRFGECLDVQVQEFFRENQWTKALDSQMLWVESKLNTSITMGQERSAYLEDIKLEKLEMLGRQMAVSRLPDEIRQPLFSQTAID